MEIGLHDAEFDHMKQKTFPNLALMKLSAYHKEQGDNVSWWMPMLPFDRVYSSKIFDFTPENPYLPTDTIRGGTGYRDLLVTHKLPNDVDNFFPDYSIYPQCDFAIGYLTRGCPRKCRWCVVPEKEGDIAPYRKWQDVVRSDTNKLTLMDNNILACGHGINQMIELGETEYKVDLNQGMDGRLVTPEIAKILSRMKWQRFIRFSCDRKEQLEAIENTLDLLGEQGIKPYRVSIYVLVTEDIEDAVYRVERLKKYKAISLYAQPEQNAIKGIYPNQQQKEFANRYIQGRCYASETWEEYTNRKKACLPWMKEV